MIVPENYRYFMRNLRRGMILFRILGVISAGMAGWALLSPGYRPWAATIFLVALLFGMANNHVSRRYNLAQKILKCPQCIFWAYATDANTRLSDDRVTECKTLMLHLRNGEQLEVNLPPNKMRDIVAWLRAQNPATLLFDPNDGAS